MFTRLFKYSWNEPSIDGSRHLVCVMHRLYNYNEGI